MNFTSQDIAVIEQALQLAIQNEAKSSKANQFREVLTKLQASATAAIQGQYLQTVAHDGLRFDYDDSSDLL
ncbi:hypothetical protein [Paenibacillus piri]|uniref:Uncharacterized protein n=1 Tax=Paenibacillus piri TaxID=2547395 RepID=A0A4R5KX04_9BACL|nr:hypothetical protein [Paenibacillus piri]TDF99577.1 hypothetical protein E1757_06990 [Paenibacillus piri]